MGEPVRKVKTYLYLGSVVTKEVGTEQDIKNCISKTQSPSFIQLLLIQKSRQLHSTAKSHLFEMNVKAVLIYGCKTWERTMKIIYKCTSKVA